MFSFTKYAKSQSNKVGWFFTKEARSKHKTKNRFQTRGLDLHSRKVSSLPSRANPTQGMAFEVLDTRELAEVYVISYIEESAYLPD
jgi:hypothetical protein